MLNPARQKLQEFLTAEPSRFFRSPPPSGRRILCSFSYLQRLGRGGALDVWFPSEFHAQIAKRLRDNDPTVLQELGVEWAAIREFALVQEADYEEDFKVEGILKAVKDLIKFRGQEGYRITVVMLGNYARPQDEDELRIHDERLQQEITNLIHMLYLEKESGQFSQACQNAVADERWSCTHILPHIVMNLGSMNITGRGPSSSKRSASIVKKILSLVDQLPRSHIIHDIAAGIALPDHDSRNRREHIVDPLEKVTAFQRILMEVLRPIDHVSMDHLHGVSETATPHYRSGQLRGFRMLRAANDPAYHVAAEMAERNLAL